MSSDSRAARQTLGLGADRDFARGRLDALARRYYAPLASFFWKRVGSAVEVQDLVQQVFLRLAQHRELDDIHSPDGYIFQTAANTLRDHFRRAAVRERFARGQLAEGCQEAADFSPERVLQGRESLSCLCYALRQLPERTRDVFMLRCFEGLRHAEIARLQGLSVRSVEKHLAKALAYLSCVLEADNREPPHAP